MTWENDSLFTYSEIEAKRDSVSAQGHTDHSGDESHLDHLVPPQCLKSVVMLSHHIGLLYISLNQKERTDTLLKLI
jgi:hypothetical protein